MKNKAKRFTSIALAAALMMTSLFSSGINQVLASGINISENTEHFTQKAKDTEGLDASMFDSSRLVVLAESEDTIVDTEHLIASYQDIYLLQYSSAEQAMNAYVYYTEYADAVEPDREIEAASSISNIEVTETGSEIEEGENAIDALSNQEDSSVTQKTDGVIALIDTGTSEGENILDRVSLIDDALTGNGHGDEMVAAITSQNPDAKILSIRAMGDDGRGSVSSIVAAMEYAMNQDVSILNLSLSAKTSLANSVLESEIQKAVSMGIDVVGAAGNDGEDVKDYMPGSVEEAWIIGACDKTGERLEGSNYGETVDYNVVADTTSEAAAKFSGYLSRYGSDTIVVNESLIYDTEYAGTASGTDIVIDSTGDSGDDIVIDSEESDVVFEEISTDGYPEKGANLNRKEYVWVNDTDFDFYDYHPYDDNVKMECRDKVNDLDDTDGSTVELSYQCSLSDNPEYCWILFVTFEFTEERYLATTGSDLLDRMMPENVNQERNEGYSGIVPSLAGETVDGKTYTVLANDEDFDITGLLLDYNPVTFKVNKVSDDGGFDVSVPGTYTVLYEMSYFMYPDYTWYVKNTVKVVDPADMEPGIYLTTKESTLMIHRESDGEYGGYGNLFFVDAEDSSFAISCIDEEYDVEISSSSEEISKEICTLTDNEDYTKKLSIQVPEDISEAVILSLYRPGYQSSKMMTSGGWQVGDYTEEELNQLSEEEFENYEEVLTGEAEAESDELMSVAASWTTKSSTTLSGTMTAGSKTGNNYSGGNRIGPCTNYGTVLASSFSGKLSDWCNDKGYTVDNSKIRNFQINCASGHSYWGMTPGKSHNVTINVSLQTNGSSSRVILTCSYRPGSSYQLFYGRLVLATEDAGGYLKIMKRFNHQTLAFSTDRVSSLCTTFGIYSDKNCTNLVTTVKLEVANDDTDYWVEVTSELLDEGNYYVQETHRITGCTENTDIYGPIPVVNGQTTNVGKYINQYRGGKQPDGTSCEYLLDSGFIKNEPFRYFGLLLNKTDTSDKPVAGAIYRVWYFETKADATESSSNHTYEWYFKTDANGQLKYDDSHYVGTWTDANGKSHKSDDLICLLGGTPALPLGYLQIQEVQAPSGYLIDTKSYGVSLNPTATTDANGDAHYVDKIIKLTSVPTSVETPSTCKVKIQKKSTAGSEILGLSSYGLEGGIFRVYTDKACTDRIGLLKTDASGLTTALTLPCNTAGTYTYYVKETAAPPGHECSTEVKSFTVTLPTDGGKTKTVSFSDDPKFCEHEFNVIKLDKSTGEVVEGAVFKLEYFDAQSADASKLVKTWYLRSDEDGMVKLENRFLVPNKGDSFFTWNGQIKIPIGGYLQLTEVEAPAKYIIDDTPIGFLTTSTVELEKKFYNKLEPCKITLHKYDENHKGLAGVEFEITFIEKSGETTSLADLNYTRLLKEGESLTKTTDANGEITFENLDQGTYRITEVSTTEGNTLLAEPITVTLPLTMTQEEVEAYGNVDLSKAKYNEGYDNQYYFFEATYEITNEATFVMPMTGAIGTWKYGYIGIAMVAAIGIGSVVYSNRKKRRGKASNK